MPALRFTPSFVVAIALLGYLGVTLSGADGDPRVFATLGAGFADGAPVDTEAVGYDGQFAYFIALDPSPAGVAGHLDVPAYRYQRILYPMSARLLGLGQPWLIPWTLVLVNLIALVGATALLEMWLVAHGMNRWYALTYGLWAGFVIAVRGNLTEPLAYALVIAAFLAQRSNHQAWAATWMGLALFAKETVLLFLAAQLAAAAAVRDYRRLALFSLSILPFAAFQMWLWSEFGQLGLGSGGWMATGFEFIPFMGLLKMAEVGVGFLVLYSVFAVPVVVWPSVWGLAVSAASIARRDVTPVVWTLAANAAIVPFTPFSTFREPFGVIRLVDGLLLAIVLFGAHARRERLLRFSLFWLAALALVPRS